MTVLDTGSATRWPGWLSTVGRLILGVVWIVAGLTKITDLDGSVRSVRAFRLLPEALAQVVGAGMPLLEILLGVLLVIGVGVRACAVLSAVLMVAYMAAIASAWARGLRIDCGCFGNGGDLAAGADPAYGADLLRDAALLVVAALVARWPTGYFAIDGLLFGRREEKA